MNKKVLALIIAGALFIVDCVPALAAKDAVAETDSAITVLETTKDEEDLGNSGAPSTVLEGATEGEDYVASQVIYFADDKAGALAVANTIGGELVDFEVGIAVAELPEGMSVYDAIKLSEDETLNLPRLEPNWYRHVNPVEELLEDEVNSLGAVEYVIPTNWDKYGKGDPFLTPGEVTYQWFHEMVQDYAAWGITKGKGIKVAVIDGGIDTSHEDFGARIIKTRVASGLVSGTDSHATNVASIIGSTLGNNKGGAGVAPEVGILGYKVVADSADASDTKSATDAQIAQAIRYAIGDGANVINMSLAGPYFSDVENKAVQEAISSGIVVVASSGNYSSDAVMYPASYKNVISVSAVNEDGSRAAFSNYGSATTVSAPGAHMWAANNANNADYVKLYMPGQTTAFYYDYKNGTSQAAPVVSGAVALYLSVAGDKQGDVNGDGKRDAKDVTAVIAAVKKSCTKSDLLGKGMGAGIINCYNLVAPFGGIEENTKEPTPEITVVPTAEPASKVLLSGGKAFGTVKDKNGILKSVQLFTTNLTGTEYDVAMNDSEKTLQLSATVIGKSGEPVGCPVVWTSTNSKIASVSSTGLVTAMRPGKVTISAIAADGTKKKASVTVNVIIPATGVAVGTKDLIADSTEYINNYYEVDHSFGTIQVGIGKSKKLGVRMLGLYGTPSIKKVTWSVEPILTEKYGITVANGTLKIPSNEEISDMIDSYGKLSFKVKATATDGSGSYGYADVCITQAPKVLAPVPVGNDALLVTSESTGKSTYIGNPGEKTEKRGLDTIKHIWYTISGEIHAVYFYSDRKDLDLAVSGSRGSIIPEGVIYTGQYFMKNNKKYYVYAAVVKCTMPKSSGKLAKKTSSSVKVYTTDGSKKSSSIKFVQYDKKPDPSQLK